MAESKIQSSLTKKVESQNVKYHVFKNMVHVNGFRNDLSISGNGWVTVATIPDDVPKPSFGTVVFTVSIYPYNSASSSGLMGAIYGNTIQVYREGGSVNINQVGFNFSYVI